MTENNQIGNNKVIPQTGKLYTESASLEKLLNEYWLVLEDDIKDFDDSEKLLNKQYVVAEVLGEAAKDFPDYEKINQTVVDKWRKTNSVPLVPLAYSVELAYNMEIREWFKRWFGEPQP